MKRNLLTLYFGLMTLIVIGQTYPKVRKQDVSNCVITKIERTSYATTVYFRYTSEAKYKNGGWVCAGDAFFIEDVQSGRRYKMIKAHNIPICPDQHNFTAANQVLDFTIDFAPINETDKINVIENETESAFNFYGVELIQDPFEPAQEVVAVPQSNLSFFSVKSSTVYLIVALIMTLFVNLFFRKRFSWWLLLLVTVVPNFLIGMLIIYFIAASQYEELFLNFNQQILAGQLGESIGSTLMAFLIIAPFFRRKSNISNTAEKESPHKESRLNPLNQFKQLTQGAFRLIIAGWFVLPLTASAIAAGISRNSDEAFFSTLFISIALYYVMARLMTWVSLGFKNAKTPVNGIIVESVELVNKSPEPEAPKIEIPKDILVANDKPKSFYLSILMSILLLICLAVIAVLFNQIDSYRLAKDELTVNTGNLNTTVARLNSELDTERSKYQIPSLVGSISESESCSIVHELTVENKLDFPVRLYISKPIQKTTSITWEPFVDYFWILEPGYKGALSTGDASLIVGGYRYYVTDTNGNYIVGSARRPVYTSIVANSLQGLKIY